MIDRQKLEAILGRGEGLSYECENICYLAREAEDGTEFRLFRRREGH